MLRRFRRQEEKTEKAGGMQQVMFTVVSSLTVAMILAIFSTVLEVKSSVTATKARVEALSDRITDIVQQQQELQREFFEYVVINGDKE
jgi:predicted thioredoxin/glutaredoxin